MLSASGALALQDEVGLADGVGFPVDLLSKEVDRDRLALTAGEAGERLLDHGQHAARAASPVVDKIGGRLHLIGDRHEDEMRHQLHHVAGGEVFAGLFVVFLAEAPNQLLEDGTHAVVVEPGQAHAAVSVGYGTGAEVDRTVEELFDQEAEDVVVDQPRDLITESEAFQDLLHIGGEAVEVGLEVGAQLLLPPDRAQVAQPERGCVAGQSRTFRIGEKGA